MGRPVGSKNKAVFTVAISQDMQTNLSLVGVKLKNILGFEPSHEQTLSYCIKTAKAELDNGVLSMSKNVFNQASVNIPTTEAPQA